jgi:basic amino acid/polyamine antiporter, APA family
VLICAALGLLAAWGIAESVTVASIVTLVEIGGLLLVVIVRHSDFADLPVILPELIPSFDLGSWALIPLQGGLRVAFFLYFRVWP